MYTFSYISAEEDDGEPPADPNPEEEFHGPIEGVYTYEQLRAKSENPVTGIDFKRREAYLSDEEFETVFEVPKEDFYKMPPWKQNMRKKKLDLF